MGFQHLILVVGSAQADLRNRQQSHDASMGRFWYILPIHENHKRSTIRGSVKYTVRHMDAMRKWGIFFVGHFLRPTTESRGSNGFPPLRFSCLFGSSMPCVCQQRRFHIHLSGDLAASSSQHGCFLGWSFHLNSDLYCFIYFLLRLKKKDHCFWNCTIFFGGSFTPFLLLLIFIPKLRKDEVILRQYVFQTGWCNQPPSLDLCWEKLVDFS